MALTRSSLADLPAAQVEGSRALVRVDFNVPLDGEGEARRVASDARMRAALPTLFSLLERGAAIVVASHLGRPKGQPDPDLSLAPVARCLQELLERPIVYLDGGFDERVIRRVQAATPGEIFLLENLRYEPGEKANDPRFAARLASCGEFFVQDAFGTCHRSHASTVGVTRHLEPCVAGQLVMRELACFDRLLQPEGLLVALLGGAKISDKLEAVRGVAERSHRICVGGGMANTFLLATGRDIGDSLVEKDSVDEARALLGAFGEKILLPVDAVVAREIDPRTERRTLPIDAVERGWKILDVGPRTVAAFAAALTEAARIFWNGPLGVFETPPFDAGTRSIAGTIAAETRRGAFSVTGGGDSIAALEAAGLAGEISHVSTGGGAALDLVSGASLPGIEALDPAGRQGDDREPER